MDEEFVRRLVISFGSELFKYLKELNENLKEINKTLHNIALKIND